MSRAKDAFGDAEIVVVTFTGTPELQRYVRWTDLQVPALLDPGRATYTAYGLERASFRRVWGLRNLTRYIRIFAGRKLTAIHKPTEDTRQLGGDFVIAPDGTLAWGHWPDGPDDRPTAESMIEAVRACR